MIQLILLSQSVDAGIYLLIILIQNLCCKLLYSDSKLICYRLHCFAGCIGISISKILLIDQSQNIGCTGIGKADTLSVL